MEDVDSDESAVVVEVEHDCGQGGDGIGFVDRVQWHRVPDLGRAQAEIGTPRSAERELDLGQCAYGD